MRMLGTRIEETPGKLKWLKCSRSSSNLEKKRLTLGEAGKEARYVYDQKIKRLFQNVSEPKIPLPGECGTSQKCTAFSSRPDW